MINFNQIQDFFVVLLAILGFISAVGTVVNLLKKWHNDSNTNKHGKILADHENRIVKLENKTKEQDDFIHVLCSSLLAMISHEINGNSKDKLEKAKSDLEKFLINK